MPDSEHDWIGLAAILVIIGFPTGFALLLGLGGYFALTVAAYMMVMILFAAEVL